MSNPTPEEIEAVIRKAIQEGAPLYNDGNIQGCIDIYLKAANEISEFSSKLLAAVDQAEKTKDSQEVVWILLQCFDSILASNKVDETESLADLLKRTIRNGAPLYNQGDKQGCFELYMETATFACEQEQLMGSAVGQLLQQATNDAKSLAESGDYCEAAWVLRRCFDDILKQSKRGYSVPTSRPSDAMSEGMSFRGTAPSPEEGSSKSGDDDGGYWQDEKAGNSTDYEIGSSLADVAYILKATIRPATHKSFTGKTYDETFQGSDAVEAMTGLGLAKNRKTAAKKATMLMSGGFIIPVSHKAETIFHDGTHLYRFSTAEQLQGSLNELRTEAIIQHPEGSLKAQLIIALETTMELIANENRQQQDGKDSVHLQRRRLSVMSPDQTEGYSLAEFAIQAERVVEVKDRSYRLKTYEKCFVGNDAVSKLVEEKIAPSREEAIQSMKNLAETGLIHHVLYEHGFEDKHLFYRFTAPGDLRKSIDAIISLPSATTGKELVRLTALQIRYQRFADLDVDSILNSFFGCDGKEGWDLVDLQNWRDNMKRWGFGRREDQVGFLYTGYIDLFLSISKVPLLTDFFIEIHRMTAWSTSCRRWLSMSTQRLGMTI